MKHIPQSIENVNNATHGEGMSALSNKLQERLAAVPGARTVKFDKGLSKEVATAILANCTTRVILTPAA